MTCYSPTMTRRELKAWVASLRRKADRSGLSNCEIARRSGITKRHVGRLLRGENVPYPQTRAKIERVLK